MESFVDNQVSSWDIDNALKKINMKSNNIEITTQEIEDVVNEFKTTVDRTITSIQERSNWIGKSSLFPKNALEEVYEAIKEKCKQYYRDIKYIENWRQEVLGNKKYLIEHLVKVVPNKKYANSIFEPCITYLQEVLEEKLTNAYNFIKKCSFDLSYEYNKILRIRYKAEEINKYGELVVTKVPEIEQKYARLREEVSKNDNLKHLKISGDKMLYVYDGDDCCSIDDNFEAFKMKYNRITEEIIDTGLYDIDLVTIQCFMNCLSRIINIIIDKYNNIMKSKNIDADEVYLSNAEHVTIAEICELVDDVNVNKKMYKILNLFMYKIVHC